MEPVVGLELKGPPSRRGKARRKRAAGPASGA